MKIGKCNVTVAEIADEVYAYGRELAGYDPADITEHGSEDAGGDIRLQVSGAGWAIHTGDSQYDQDHRGAWGCGWVPAGVSRHHAREIARDLMDEAADDAAMIADVEDAANE